MTPPLPTLGLDTSVVLRLLVGVPAGEAAAARRLVDTATAPLVVSDLVVAESYFALRHHYAVPHRAAIAALGTLLADTRLRASGVARAILAHATSEAPGLMDRLIHADYRHEGASLATFDRDAAKLNDAHLVA